VLFLNIARAGQRRGHPTQYMVLYSMFIRRAESRPQCDLGLGVTWPMIFRPTFVSMAGGGTSVIHSRWSQESLSYLISADWYFGILQRPFMICVPKLHRDDTNFIYKESSDAFLRAYWSGRTEH
jgi:hypothetical protein